MTKAHAKSLMERINRMRNLMNAAIKPEEQGEMAKISAEEFDYHFMCMEQIIEAASETPEEREARLEREDDGWDHWDRVRECDADAFADSIDRD